MRSSHRLAAPSLWAIDTVAKLVSGFKSVRGISDISSAFEWVRERYHGESRQRISHDTISLA